MLLCLLIAGYLCGPAPVQVPHPEKAVEATSEIILTETEPMARVHLPANVRSIPVPFLEIPITLISNPREMPFSIFVYLEWTRSTDGPDARQRTLLGNFTVYPPNQPGKFLLRTSKGFERLKRMGANLEADQIFLFLEMKRVDPSKPWAPIRATIGPVRWRSEL
jgi:hypothetical protein